MSSCRLASSASRTTIARCRSAAGRPSRKPYMVAIMTQVLCPTPADLVLEVGTGSGYQAAVLSKLVCEAVSIEWVPPLADRARATLARLGVSNVTVLAGDGSEGFAERQPYNGIIVTAGAPRAPQTLRQQLAEGGRLVIPVGDDELPAASRDPAAGWAL